MYSNQSLTDQAKVVSRSDWGSQNTAELIIVDLINTKRFIIIRTQDKKHRFKKDLCDSYFSGI